MFEGYLCVGGTEVGNNARARGYAESADCSVGWFVGDQCETLADALGSPEGYTLDNISEAPWFDPNDPSTSRFYGAYITSLGEISSSTRAGTFTEGIDDGGIPGSQRHAGKSFRVRAWLTAEGEDALETGHRWLDAALQARSCGTHAGGACGASDLTFLTACPPAREIVPDFSPWVQQAEDLFTNPSFEAGAGTVTIYENLFTNPELEAGSGTVEVRRNLNPTPDWSQAFTGWATSNMTDEGAVPGGRTFSGTYTFPNINRLGGSALTMPSTQFMQGWRVKVADASAPVTFVNRMVADSTNIRKTGVTVQPGDEAYIAHIFEPVAGQASFRPVLEISNPDGAAFEFTVLDGVTVESTAIVRPAFSPGIPTPDPDLTPSWTGAANASPSILSGTPVAGVATNQCVAIRSSKVVNGVAYPLRLIPTSSANSTFVRISVPTAAHAGGTLIATRYQDAPLTGSLHGANYNIRVDSPTHTVTRTNIAGPVENRLVFGALSGTYEAYLAHGGAQDSGDVWYRAVGIFAGDYTGPFFSGDTPHPDPDFTTSWVGAANASVSRVTAAAIPEIGGAAVRYRSSHWAASGSNSMRVQRPSASDVYVTLPTPGVALGKTYTIMFTTRVAEPIALAGIISLQQQSGAWPYIPLLPTGTALSGVQEHRFTVTVPAGGQWTNASSIRLVLRPDSAVNGPGIWYDNLAIIEGEYDGPYFDGNTHPDSDGALQRTRWMGAENDSVSVYETRSPLERPASDAEYEEALFPYVRHMHNVICISGPLEIETRKSRDGIHWGRLVEFTLYAGKPWLYGERKQLDLAPTPATVVQDAPFNLAVVPSAELQGAAIVAATNYSTNPSVEVNANSWTTRTDGTNLPSSALSSGRVTGELAAVGNSSFRVVFQPTSAGSNGYFAAMQEVDISSRPAGSRVSISLWAAQVLLAGSPVRADTKIIVFWLNSSGGTLRIDNLGTAPMDGGAVSAKSILPPAGTARAAVRAQVDFTSWTADTQLRLYTDALAVTVP